MAPGAPWRTLRRPPGVRWGSAAPSTLVRGSGQVGAASIAAVILVALIAAIMRGSSRSCRPAPSAACWTTQQTAQSTPVTDYAFVLASARAARPRLMQAVQAARPAEELASSQAASASPRPAARCCWSTGSPPGRWHEPDLLPERRRHQPAPYATGETALTGGWWLDAQANAAKRAAPSQALTMYLADPAPPSTGPRAIFDYAARISTIQTSGGLRFLVTFPGTGTTPPQGSACTDPTTGCWITATLRAVDPDRTTPQTITLLPNTVSAFDVTVHHGHHPGETKVLSRRLRGGAPYTQDADGDAVTVTLGADRLPLDRKRVLWSGADRHVVHLDVPGAWHLLVRSHRHRRLRRHVTSRTVDVYSSPTRRRC